MMADNEQYATEEVTEEIIEEEIPEEVAEEEEKSAHEQYIESITQISDDEREELFGVKGITDVPEEDDDYSDLLDVDMEDLYGDKEEETPPKRVRRVRRLKPQQPFGLGGVRG